MKSSGQSVHRSWEAALDKAVKLHRGPPASIYKWQIGTARSNGATSWTDATGNGSLLSGDQLSARHLYCAWGRISMPEWLRVFWTTAFLAFVGAVGNGAWAQEEVFAPFLVSEDEKSIILDGEIDMRAALNFRRAAAAAPNAKTLVLNSPGGAAEIALLIADDVHGRGMSTLIPRGAGCYSACSYIFLAGRERHAEGKLGVHQISSESPDLKSAQITISDIIDMLDRFGTPAQVLAIMFRTPPDPRPNP